MQGLTEPKYIVDLYPDTDLRFSSKIYAGLSDLSEQGVIELELLYRLPKMLKPGKYEFNHQCIWTRITDHRSGQQRNICFDVEDGRWINSISRLNACDVYYKRSFSDSVVGALPYSLRRKIRPFGLHFACRSRQDNTAQGRLLIYYLHRRFTVRHPLNGWRTTMRQWRALRRDLQTGDYPFLYTDRFEVEDLDADPGDRIVYFFRLWEPERCPNYDRLQLEALNTLRAETYRHLKAAFGERLLGGAIDTAFARQTYPDCVSEMPTDQVSFLGYIRQGRICVTTTGLHGAIGCRMSEYLAAGKCIVTEPLLPVLPAPLVENANKMTFATADECVKACRILMDDDGLARQMQLNNLAYYREHVKPDRHLLTLIQDSFQYGR